MSIKNITVLIAEDEALGRSKIVNLVKQLDWVNSVIITKDGEQALKEINSKKPDLVFMDINMPKLSGIDVILNASHQPHVIFTTAYDQYAIKAFELGAIDYLLKPFSNKRFQSTIDRIQELIPTHKDSLLQFNSLSSKNNPINYLFVRDGNRIKKIIPNEIEWIEGDCEYLRIHLDKSSYLIRLRMYEIEKLLSSHDFIKVHRSRIVNLNKVKDLKSIGNGRFMIIFYNNTCVNTSREGAKILRSKFL